MGESLTVVVLAAGEGKRFRSALPKPLHPVAGRPLLWHVLAAAAPLKAERTVVVVGNGADQVTAAVDGFDLGPVAFATQAAQRGTGDALAAAVPLLEGDGDVHGPVRRHPAGLDGAAGGAAGRPPLGQGGRHPAHLHPRRPDGLRPGAARPRRGRHRDRRGARRHPRPALAPRGQRRHVRVPPARPSTAWPALRPDNHQGEYYLPDLVPLVLAGGGRVATAEGPEEEARGVNDRVELAAAEAVLRRRLLERLMLGGVTVTDPATTFVDADVEVGQDTVLAPLTFLEARHPGRGPLPARAQRAPGRLHRRRRRHRRPGRGPSSTIGPRVVVGPFASLRPGTELAEGAKAGTFVEVKNSVIGPGSKVPHLSYVGDADIGAGANVGAGTVFVNYDGARKHRTTVGDGAFIGSDTMLVAPVTVGNGAQTAAGSTITKDVPPDALAIERSDQRTIEGWAARRRRQRTRE